MKLNEEQTERLTALMNELDECGKLVSDLRDEAESDYEEMSERQKEAEKGCNLGDMADSLRTLADDLEQARSTLEEVLS